MKRTRWNIASILLVAVLGLSATSIISGYQGPGIGEYVNVAPLKDGVWQTPPGHYGLMASYANSYFSKAPSNGNYIVTWSFVQPNWQDYFIVDVRPSGFCTSHIIGSINIPFAELAEPYNLEKLPTNRPILVVCGSGILASQAGSVLGLMGYQVRILTTKLVDVPNEYKESCTPF
jgi:rhodanese-related sulfurtransferase